MQPGKTRRGVHSDVVGGNGNIGLSTITFRWTLCKAIALGYQSKRQRLQATRARLT
jgi:hypothetical protein